MSEQRDPLLESLFAGARQELGDEDFRSGLMARVRSRGRRVMFGRLAIVALLIAIESLLDAPLQNSVGVFADMLGTRLFETDREWLAFAIAPVNSIAGLLGLGLLGLHFLYRKLFY